MSVYAGAKWKPLNVSEIGPGSDDRPVRHRAWKYQMPESDTKSKMPLTGTALMPVLRLAPIAILTIALSACNSGPQTDAESAVVDVASEEETLMELEREWSGMYGQRDVDGIAALLASESVLL